MENYPFSSPVGKFLDCENGVMGGSGEDLELREGIAEEDKGATRETATARGSTFDQKDWWCLTSVAAKLGVEEKLLVGEFCLAVTWGSSGRRRALIPKAMSLFLLLPAAPSRLVYTIPSSCNFLKSYLWSTLCHDR